MAELRHALHALVDNRPAPPPPVDLVAARGARFAVRRRVAGGLAAFAVAVCAGAGVLLVGGDDASTITVASGGPASAAYLAEAPGGYVATGTWRLTIRRPDKVIELSSASSDHCGSTGVIQPGDEVHGSIDGPGSSLRGRRGLLVLKGWEWVSRLRPRACR